MDTYKVIGLMSGTSLDGVDLAYCEFTYNNSWKYKIVCAETIAYPFYWIENFEKLVNGTKAKAERASVEYGEYLGSIINDFKNKHDISADFIASHGHTIFHQPEKKYTLQIGDGKAISKIVKLPVIYDFRSLDVKLGGQGAPLVPIGDKFLFGNYTYCINFGGIANISYENKGSRIAYDICPVNMVLNHYSKKLGFEYDAEGHLASRGNLHKDLLNQLNKLDYYQQSPPKSIGREWVEQNIFPLIEKFDLDPIDVLRTFTEHITIQINNILQDLPVGKILITGGGAKNLYLIDQLQKTASSEIIIPDDTIIEYKESLIFAFLGLLRFRNEINCLSSVTGAVSNHSSGSLIN